MKKGVLLYANIGIKDYKNIIKMVCFVCAGMHRAPALFYDLMDAEYSVSAPAENKSPAA